MKTKTQNKVEEAIKAAMSRASRARTTESRRKSGALAWRNRLANLAQKLGKEGDIAKYHE